MPAIAVDNLANIASSSKSTDAGYEESIKSNSKVAAAVGKVAGGEDLDAIFANEDEIPF